MRIDQAQRVAVLSREWLTRASAAVVVSALWFGLATPQSGAAQASPDWRAPRGSASQTAAAPASAARPKFTFWYEPWKGRETFEKLGHSEVVIGLAPSNVPGVHQMGARALRYVTFYQSRFGETYLKDAADLPNVGFWNGHEFLKSAFGGENNYVLCDNSKVVHDRVLADVQRMLLEKQFDGFFVDNTYLDPAAHEYCKSTVHTHIQPNLRGDDAFLELLAEVRNKVKELSPSAIIVSNAGMPSMADRVGSGRLNVWDLSDQVLWESYGYSSYRDARHDRWPQAIKTSFSLPDAKRRKIIALSYPLDVAEAEYSFAMARIFGFEWTANLGESQAGTKKEGGHFGAFLPKIPFDLGMPITPMQGTAASDRISRKFEHGEAIANISDRPIRVVVPAGVRLYVADRVSDTTSKSEVTLSRRTAAVFIYPTK